MPRSRPAARTVPAGWGTAVALGASTALLLFSALTIGSALWTRRARTTPPTPPRTVAAATDVDLWVGELVPGVKAVLSAEWNHPDWDHAQDARWNAGLASPAPGRADPPALAFYALVAFNTSGAAVTLSFPEGAFRVLGPAGSGPRDEGATLRSVDLASWLAQPAVADSAAATTLRMLGADREVVELPPGKMLRRPVAFLRRVSLAETAGVSRGDGVPFRRRRMPRSEWAGLLVSPSVEQVSAL